MAVASDKCEQVLATKRCHPEIVYGNRLAESPEANDDGCIVAGSFLIYIEDGGVGQETFELTERNTLRSGFGFGAAKNGVWDFARGLHILVFPYLWERVNQRAKSLSVTGDGDVSHCILP